MDGCIVANGASVVSPHPTSASSINANAAVDAGQAPQGVLSDRNRDGQQLHIPNDGNQGLSSTAGDSSTPHHPIAEFLYQLTKMLTDNNNEIVEWNNGKIKVHYPDRLEAEVLHKYFRHSKFASFQRQLNYFGFRKIAGKGKMSPCSYVNDGATTDLRSLLSIKRKTNGSAARKAAMAQRAAGVGMHGQMGMGLHGGMPMSADFFTQAFMGNPAAQQSLGVYSGMMFDAQQQAALQQAAFQHQALQNASQHQKQNVESLYLPGDPYAAMARKLPTQDLGGLAKKSGLAGSLEHLQQLSAARNSALNLAGFGWSPASITSMSSMFAPAPSQQGAAGPVPSPVPASMPATAAMNATAAANVAASNQSSNVFESNTALNALVDNNNAPSDHKSGQNTPAPGFSGAPAPGATVGPAPGTYTGGAGMPYSGSTLQQRRSSSNLLRGLPSAGTMFPDSLSSVSLSGLLPGMSSNRLNSMLSLSSFLSRDPSMVDLIPGASNVNLAGLANGAPYNNGFTSGGYNPNGYSMGGLGNTTLVPLTGGTSSQFDFAGASAALQSLANAGGPASSFLGAFNTNFVQNNASSNANTTSQSAAANVPSVQQVGAPVGFEPTPIQDMGQQGQ
jgi:hypothetical protein